MTRREVLRTAALGVFSLPLLSSVGQAAAAAAAPATPARVERLRLGIASYSLRNLSLDDAIATVKTLRISNIALFKNHCAWETASVEECRAVGAKLKAAGLTLTGSGVVNLTNDEAKCRKAFENVKAAGMLTMVCKPDIAALPLVEKLVKEFDQKLAIHNHGPEDKLYPTPEVAWNAIKSLDARIGLCIDVGHTARFGDDVVTSIKKYSARLYDVHMKDSIAIVGAQKDVPIEVGAGRRGDVNAVGAAQAIGDAFRRLPNLMVVRRHRAMGPSIDGRGRVHCATRASRLGLSGGPRVVEAALGHADHDVSTSHRGRHCGRWLSAGVRTHRDAHQRGIGACCEARGIEGIADLEICAVIDDDDERLSRADAQIGLDHALGDLVERYLARRLGSIGGNPRCVPHV